MSMFDSYFQKLQPSFEVDPMLLRLFVKVTALEEVSLLFGKIPTSILLMRLTEESTSGNQVLMAIKSMYYINVLAGTYNCTKGAMQVAKL